MSPSLNITTLPSFSISLFSSYESKLLLPLFLKFIFTLARQRGEDWRGFFPGIYEFVCNYSSNYDLKYFLFRNILDVI